MPTHPLAHLLRLVGVMCVNLFQADDVTVDVEPDAGIAAQCRLVLPACVDVTVTPNGAEFVAKPVVVRGGLLGRRGKEVPASASGFRIVAARSIQPFLAEFVANRMRYSPFFVGRGTGVSFVTF
ncbi:MULTISPECIES: hypothetical protein [unclassified Pseudoclavibacter]|uniref:hypothetical protein n=1 Tax=unclassified Pseudoclavibacter TaxID=2615177 RepID=UPI001BAC6D41|nr:hypothetical protein [Pseudoclavibacter sp. Marseille-Q4354]MBS3178771.1 hypothetical protein [Pseudoclavibacter sp. Marseille-Q4354]